MNKVDFAALTAPFRDTEIEWRISDIRQAARDQETVIVPYLQATAVRNRLDSVLGPQNWQSDIEHVPGGMICRLSIKIDGEWVSKADAAQETDQFPLMGASSRALVRAASAWGVGRYLNELPELLANYCIASTPGSRPLHFREQTFHHIPPDISKFVNIAVPKPQVQEPPKPQMPPRPTVEQGSLGTKSQVEQAKTEIPRPGKMVDHPSNVRYIPQSVQSRAGQSSQQASPAISANLNDNGPLPDCEGRPYCNEKIRFGRTKGKRFKEHTLAELKGLIDFLNATPLLEKRSTIEDKQRLIAYLGGKLEMPKYA